MFCSFKTIPTGLTVRYGLNFARAVILERSEESRAQARNRAYDL